MTPPAPPAVANPTADGQNEFADSRRVFLSTAIASPREIRLAQAAVLASAVLLFAAVPFGKRLLPEVTAFIPAYEAALITCDLITAVLLFNQYRILRSQPLLVLIGGYVFTATVAFMHMLTFPDVFSSSGLLGAGPQTSAWLYTFWHGGFPLFVVLYALLKDGRCEAKGTNTVSGWPRRAIGLAGLAPLSVVGAVLAVVAALTFVATAYEDSLPALMVGGHFSLAVHRSSVLLSALLALIALRWRRPYTALDVWLTVVMFAWFFDVALSGVLNANRFDFGWYAGRLYGLLAASFLLIVLLIENGTQYGRFARLSTELGAANKLLEQLSLHDGLTNLANRRSFDAHLATQMAIAHRYTRTLALIMYDVDAFKSYNDHHGHLAGDECLKQIAAALDSCCRRPGDMLARYGGEEFAMILPDTGLIGAARIAEAARDAVAQLQIPHENSPAASYVSISGGIAVVGTQSTLTVLQLIDAADQALYQAKHLGGNRIVSPRAAPGATPKPHMALDTIPST